MFGTVYRQNHQTKGHQAGFSVEFSCRYSAHKIDILCYVAVVYYVHFCILLHSVQQLNACSVLVE